MSFQGKVEARCPKGCEPVEVDVWSFVRGDSDEALRDCVLARDLNLLSCEDCGSLYYPECTVVYYDAVAELVAFVFPESYAAEERRWRLKMEEDYEQMRGALTAKMPVLSEPLIFFGIEGLSRLLETEDDLEDEARVAEAVCRELGLACLAVDRGYARGLGLPRVLPTKGRGGAFARAEVLAGLKALVTANPRLEGYKRWVRNLAGGEDVPLARRAS